MDLDKNMDRSFFVSAGSLINPRLSELIQSHKEKGKLLFYSLDITVSLFLLVKDVIGLSKNQYYITCFIKSFSHV